MKAKLFLFTLFIVFSISLLACGDQEASPSQKHSLYMDFISKLICSVDPIDINHNASKATNELMDFINQAMANLRDYSKLGNLTDQMREGLESCSRNFQNAKNDIQVALNNASSGSSKEAIDQLKQIIGKAKSCDDNLSDVGQNVDKLKIAWKTGMLVANVIAQII